jgi:L-alanine-DL-glutamate epimerase-like enolase superfamily enzyme
MLHFDLDQLDASLRIMEISGTHIPYKRPRIAGRNARLDVHGWGGDFPFARIKAGGIEGSGWCTLTRAKAEMLAGIPIRAMFQEDGMLRGEFRNIEFPILDWLGHFFHKPVYMLVSRNSAEPKDNYSVPVYDTSIYFDELDIPDDRQAIEFIFSEVSQGIARGHCHFKVKIGRCGMWMGLREGLRRDIDIILGIRELVGPDAKLMADANNGYNLNITKEFLAAVKDAKLYWLEEAFHEDNMLYTALRNWMREQGLKNLIADGEGSPLQPILGWAEKGLVDVLQFDLRSYGFFNWMELCRKIEPFSILCAPHNYGGFYGNYAQAHFAACTGSFSLAEFDAADAEGIDTSGYKIKDGRLEVPSSDGFGLHLDSVKFERLCAGNGYRICI